jgi:GAF domain-containing protein
MVERPESPGPPVLPGEEERLRVLRQYRILDTQSEKAFDDLTRLAAVICGTPIALITLVDEGRQWFKSRIGLADTETPRQLSFCAHAIGQEDVFVVEDATRDRRFEHNPLVTSDPGIRFYAGAPLAVGSGHALGALCVIDRTPRQLTPQQLDALRILRQAIVTQLEARRALEDLDLLQQVLPMCSWCRSVHQGDGSWRPLHEYVSEAVSVSHGMCPACERTVGSEWNT